MTLWCCLLTELYSYTEEPEFAENQTCYEEAVGGTRMWHLLGKKYAVCVAYVFSGMYYTLSIGVEKTRPIV